MESPCPHGPYYQPTRPSAEEVAIKHRIDEIYTERPSYGSRPIAAVLRPDFIVNRKSVQRHTHAPHCVWCSAGVREMGVAGIVPGPNMSKRNAQHKIYQCLLRNDTDLFAEQFRACYRPNARVRRQRGIDRLWPCKADTPHAAKPKLIGQNNMSRTYTFLATLVGVVCVYFIIRLLFFIDPSSRTVQSDVIQGILIGFGLAFVTAQIYARIKATKVNGWITMFGLGVPGNGMLLRAAHAQLFLGPVNVPQEAMYWWANVDGAGHTLSGKHDYIMHFPPGGLPPNDAFWSLTMGTSKNHFVANPINRYSVSDRSGLVPNADGSVDIYIQNTAPAGHESNWLPAPTGNFILWLRAYVPGQAVLDGKYKVPPVVPVK